MSTTLKFCSRGLLVSLFLLLGGVKMEHNKFVSGASSCHAIIVHNPPAKEKATPKNNRRYNRIIKWMKPDNYYSRLGTAIVILLVALVGATIAFGIWSVSLFVAAKYGAGIIVGILSLAGLFGIYKFFSKD